MGRREKETKMRRVKDKQRQGQKREADIENQDGERCRDMQDRDRGRVW